MISICTDILLNGKVEEDSSLISVLETVTLSKADDTKGMDW